ncbi:MAG: leucine-rich repeat protein [Clostridia bacterium]|nr:leucine-rich repeat protein [Clostridia bacterium]
MMYASGYQNGGRIHRTSYPDINNDGILEEDLNVYNGGDIIQDHPFNVGALYSFGTPYIGTELDEPWAHELIGETTFNSPSAKNILDEIVQTEIKSNWEAAVTKNPNLRLYACAGEISLNFVLGMIAEEREKLEHHINYYGYADDFDSILQLLANDWLPLFIQILSDIKVGAVVVGIGANLSIPILGSMIFIVSATTVLTCDILTQECNDLIPKVEYVISLESVSEKILAVDDILLDYYALINKFYDEILMLTEGSTGVSSISDLGDLFIDTPSQLAEGFVNVERFTKVYNYTSLEIVEGESGLEVTNVSRNFYINKLSVNNVAIAHNLETYDLHLHSQVRYNITLGVPSTICNYMEEQDGTAKITGYTLPSYYNNTFNNLQLDLSAGVSGKVVSCIGANAFADFTSLKSIILPSSLQTIEDSAFSGCTSLTTVIFDEDSQIEAIGAKAFYDCRSLTSIDIPNGITTINEETFYGCTALNNVNLPSGLTEILGSAFFATGIEEITIPNTVTNIGPGAFSSCYNLTEITLPNSISFLGGGVFLNCMNLSSVTLPSNLTAIPNNMFNGCVGLSSINIPQGVTQIGVQAFRYTGLTSITLPVTISSIGDRAFSNCSSIISLTIGLSESLSIGSNAFAYCSKLDYVDISLANIQTMGDGVFRGCTSISTIYFPDSLTSITSNMFYGCSSLDEVIIHEGITSIGENAFYGSGIERIILSDGITSIESNAFDGSSLSEIVVTSDNQYYSSHDGILYNKEKTALIYVPKKILGGVSLPSSLTAIASEAFLGRDTLTSVTIPCGIESIGSNAFADCAKLTIYIEENTIAPNEWHAEWNSSNRPVIWGCTLAEMSDYLVSFVKTPTSIQNANAVGGISAPSREGFQFDGWAITEGGEALYNMSNVVNVAYNTTLYAIWTESTVAGFRFTLLEGGQAYEVAAKYGATLTGEIIIPSTYNGLPVTAIAQYGFVDNAYNSAYADTSSVISVVIPSSIVNIGSYAFQYCDIRNVKFTSNSALNSIGEGAFSGCSKLESITIPRRVRSIEKLAFYNCTNLSSVIFEQTSLLRCLGDNVFDSCEALERIELPNSIVNMGTNVFEKCRSLAYVKLPDSLTTIPDGTFQGCAFTSIDLPTTVTTIGDGAFLYSKLSSIALLSSVTKIKAFAFSKTNLTTIEIPASVTEIAPNAFDNCSKLTTVILPEADIEVSDVAFSNCNSLTKIIVPDNINAYNAYKGKLPNLQYYIQCNVTEEGVELVYTLMGDGTYAVSGSSSNITGELIIPAYYNDAPVTIIANNAFENCTEITSVVIPSTVTIIGLYAFSGCTSLTWVDMPNVFIIGAYAFNGCINIEDIVLPSSVIYIDEDAFIDCDNLGVVVLLRTAEQGITLIHPTAFEDNGLICFVVFDEDSYYDYYDYFEQELSGLEDYLQYVMYI